MKNETKRDVFNKLLAAYLEDEKRLDELVNEPDEHIPELDFMYFKKSYAAALTDDLPVILKEVGEILRSAHGQTDLLGVLNTAKNGYKISETLEWIYSNQDTFARAWLDGYVVEDNA